MCLSFLYLQKVLRPACHTRQARHDTDHLLPARITLFKSNVKRPVLYNPLSGLGSAPMQGGIFLHDMYKSTHGYCVNYN